MEKFLTKLFTQQFIPKTAKSRGIRYIIHNAQPYKTAKGESISYLFFKPHIAQIIHTL